MFDALIFIWLQKIEEKIKYDIICFLLLNYFPVKICNQIYILASMKIYG